jgi:sortase A
MMPKIQRRPTRLALFIPWAQYFFLFVGAFALSYCAFVLIDRGSFQAYQTQQFERALRDSQMSASVDPEPTPSLPVSRGDADRTRIENSPLKVLPGSLLGRIEIRSIGLTAIIMEGIDGNTLRLAVGHIPGTAIPGQHGNVGLAAHRDTFFRGLRNIHKDDEIVLTTLQGSFRYIVDSTRVVEPDNIKVLAATTDNVLTLVTCYPIYYVGPAPQRFIVRAHRNSEP